MERSGKSLKARNQPALWGVVGFDAVFIFLLFSPTEWNQAALLQAALTRGVLAMAIPAAVLLLTAVLPDWLKEILVFWRVRHTLPGHRAFSSYAAADPRIDLERLRKNIGAFPSDPREQNATWYRLFKKVEAEPAVDHAHGRFLLLRDLAAISAALLVIAPCAWMVDVIPAQLTTYAAAVFGFQFFLAALGARFQADGLVSTVLALHGAKRRV